MLTFKRTEKLSKKTDLIFLPILDGKISAPAIAKIFNLNLTDELAFFTPGDKPLKAGETFEIPVSADGYKCEKAILVSLGKSTNSEIRTAGAAIGRKLRGKELVAYLENNLKSAEAKAILISANLGNFQWNLKSNFKDNNSTLEISNVDENSVSKAQITSDAVNRARQLIHTPSNIKNPAWIAKQAEKLANGVKVEVKSGSDLREFGGLIAVGGSVPKPGPRFIKMTYTPRKTNGKKIKHIVLVGKGITYDSGGLSLKRPHEIMAPMKSDMAGAAACLAVMSALKDLNPKVKVTALLMCAENAISATAQRPGDVIAHYGGKTVEVINTDAEGRLVLADGLAYAAENLAPDYLIDIATLTGAITLGLGRQYAAVYSRNSKLVKELKVAGEISGDRVWHMPLVDDYEIGLESDIADLNHTADKGKHGGGSITAALFLEKFATGMNWAHLDIAGTGRADSDSGENPKGGTGWGVRLLLEWIGTFK